MEHIQLVRYWLFPEAILIRVYPTGNHQEKRVSDHADQPRADSGGICAVSGQQSGCTAHPLHRHPGRVCCCTFTVITNIIIL